MKLYKAAPQRIIFNFNYVYSSLETMARLWSVAVITVVCLFAVIMVVIVYFLFKNTYWSYCFAPIQGNDFSNNSLLVFLL